MQVKKTNKLLLNFLFWDLTMIDIASTYFHS